MFLVFLALDAERVVDPLGKPIAHVVRYPVEACQGPSAPKWLEGEWTLVFESEERLVICSDEEQVEVIWRVRPISEDRARVAGHIGPGHDPSAPPGRSARVYPDEEVLLHLAVTGARSPRAHRGGLMLEARVTPDRNVWMGGLLSAGVWGSKPLGVGLTGEFLVGPARWMFPNLSVAAVAGPAVEGGGGLPWAVQLPMELWAIVNVADWVMLNAHARATPNLVVDPQRWSLPHQDVRVGVDASLLAADGLALVVGTEVRWHLGQRALMVHFGLGFRSE